MVFWIKKLFLNLKYYFLVCLLTLFQKYNCVLICFKFWNLKLKMAVLSKKRFCKCIIGILFFKYISGIFLYKWMSRIEFKNFLDLELIFQSCTSQSVFLYWFKSSFVWSYVLHLKFKVKNDSFIKEKICCRNKIRILIDKFRVLINCCLRFLRSLQKVRWHVRRLRLRKFFLIT